MSSGRPWSAQDATSELRYILNRYRGDIELAGNDPDRVAALKADTSATLAAHRRAYERGSAREFAEACEPVFGLSALLAGLATDARFALQRSYREAYALASEAKDEQSATTLLRRAELTGDELLTRAVGLVAAEQLWGDVLDEYDARVADGEQKAALARLRRYLRDADEARDDFDREAVRVSMGIENYP